MSQSGMVIDAETGEIVEAGDAWERHQRIVALRNVAEETFLALGEDLYWFREKEQWRQIGHPTLKSYLGDPDVDIAQPTAFRLMGVYHTYVKRLQLSQGQLLTPGYRKLYMLRSYVTRQNVDEWLGKAATLSRSDLRMAIAEAFPKTHPPFPPGTFSVLYADPPWAYQHDWQTQAAAGQYATLHWTKVRDYKDPDGRQVPDLCTPETVLFLWVTSPHLDHGVAVLKGWGFEYKASMIWDKGRAPGMGWWMRTYHELLLVGARKDSRPPAAKPISVIRYEPGRHSAKPEELYGIIEAMYRGPYCELFGRGEPREGWEMWGDEVGRQD